MACLTLWQKGWCKVSSSKYTQVEGAQLRMAEDEVRIDGLKEEAEEGADPSKQTREGIGLE